MRYYSTILFYLFISLLFVGCGESNQTEQGKIYLPYLQKEQATQSPVIQPSPSVTPTTTPSPTPTPLPTHTPTRPANPYHPIVKHYIDVGYLGDIGLNTQNNTAYVRNNYNTLLPVRNGIPDFERVMSVKPGTRGNIVIDEVHNRMYVLSSGAVEIVDQGVTVFDLNEQLLYFVPFGGLAKGMVFEPNQGWVYVYGIPDPHLNRDDEGILMILDGTTVIEKVDPWDIRVFKSAVDPSTGHVYFASQYDRPDDVHDSGSPYGRIDIYTGTERIKTYKSLFTNIHTMIYQPKHQTVNVYTGIYYVSPYDTTIFRNAEIISQTKSFSGTLVGGISAGTVYTPTGELYLTDGENLAIMSDEIVPQLKKQIKLSGTPAGFENIIMDPFSGNIYLNNWYDGTLTIIHNEEIIGKMWLTRDLSYVALNPKNGDLYLSSGHAGRIWILGFDEQTVFPKDP